MPQYNQFRQEYCMRVIEDESSDAECSGDNVFVSFNECSITDIVLALLLRYNLSEVIIVVYATRQIVDKTIYS